MTASYDTEGHVHINFTLMASVKVSRRKTQLEMKFVVSPEADFSHCSPIVPDSTTDGSPSTVASVLQEADISDESGHVFVIRFVLTSKAFVVAEKVPDIEIRPYTSTSNQLIRDLESLSGSSVFSVYVRPSRNAWVGLAELCKRLGNTSMASMEDTLEMYIHKGAMLVRWELVVYRKRRDARSSSHTAHPVLSLPTAEVPRIKQEPEEGSSLMGTLLQTPANPEVASLNHSTSYRDEVSSDNGFNLRGLGEDVGSEEASSSDSRSRVASQQLEHEMLDSRLMNWLACASKINKNVHQHQRLLTRLSVLGDCVRKSNVEEFDATLVWCSAVLFYDPLGTGDPELWRERNRWLVFDIVDLIEWANGHHLCAEMSSGLVDDFKQLGSIARTVALRREPSDAAYTHQRSVCITRVLVGYSKAPGSVDGDGPDSVSRKRNTDEGSSANPKRARNRP